METLCKLYLELANVVPPDCISSRENAQQKWIDRYGVILRCIVDCYGVGSTPEQFARNVEPFITEAREALAASRDEGAGLP